MVQHENGEVTHVRSWSFFKGLKDYTLKNILILINYNSNRKQS